MLREGPIPRFLHGVIEYAYGVIFVAAPFLFGFSGEAASTAFFIIMGMGFLLICIGTRFRD